MSVAVQQQAKTQKAGSPAKKPAGPDAAKKTPPPNIKASEEKRKEGTTLAGAVGQSLNNTAGAVASASGEVLKEGARQSVRASLNTVSKLIQFKLSLLPPFLTKPVISFFASQLDSHMKANQINLGIPASTIINELFYGDTDKLGDEVVDVVHDVIRQSFTPELEAALESKNPLKIATAFGFSLKAGAVGLASKIFKYNGSKNFLTSPFKFFGDTIPFIKKLSPKFRPWAAGAGIFMFGGLAVRLAMKAVKFVLAGGLLAGGYAVIKKAFSGGAGAMGRKAGMGSAMNMLGGLAGGGGAKPGLGGAMNMLSGLAGAGGGGAKPGLGGMMNMLGGLAGGGAGPAPKALAA